MDEYEVDLRDYLTVMWERKWIIVGVFVVAVMAAAIYSYTLPDEYRADALVSYQRPASESIQLGLPDTGGFISVVEAADGVRADTLNGTDLVRLQIEGAASPATLANRLQQAIGSVRSFLRDEIEARLAERLSALGDEIAFLREQRTALIDRVSRRDRQRLEVFQAQRDRLVQQIDQLMQGSSDGSLEDGAMRQASLLALTAQLQVLQSQMARLEASSDAPQPEAGSAYEQRLADLETRLQELELSQRQYQRLRDTDWSPLSIAQAPQGSGAPIGPNRSLNVAIAGVLGLFMGLLLAFFVHYLQNAPAATDERTPRSRQDET